MKATKKKIKRKVKFTTRYNKCVQICRDLVPKEHISKLEYDPLINPPLKPLPRDWFVNSYTWYVGLKLIQGKRYGPFYRVDGDSFWPRIGNMENVYSQEKCFLGLERPIDVKDVERLYNIIPTTSTEYVYKIFIEIPDWPAIEDAYLFLGPVKGAEGFQVSPNRRVVDIIRQRILMGGVERYKRLRGGKYSKKSEVYEVNAV